MKEGKEMKDMRLDAERKDDEGRTKEGRKDDEGRTKEGRKEGRKEGK